MLERRRTSSRSRIVSLSLAGAAHLAAVGLLLLPALFSSPAPAPIVIVMDAYRAPAAPKLGGGGSTQAAAPVATQKIVAKATPKATPDFVQPQAIPDTTPVPDDTAVPADDTALAQNGATGPIGDPNAPIGPGVPTGRADSECLVNCDENGLPGGSNPIPSHLLAIAPVAIEQPQPKYPPSARTAHITGSVVVEIIVGVDGRVQSAKVVRGGAPFEAPTLDAVKRWRYMPVMHQGKPIVWKSNVTIRFQLD